MGSITYPQLVTHCQLKRKNILSVPTWGVSTHRFLVQHQQTSLNERPIYVQLQFSRLSYNDDGLCLATILMAIKPMRINVLITRLCYFFNTVSQKVIGRKELDDLKAYMIETMCMLEMCFPPFFDMQEHLMIHLMDQIHTLGLLYLHSMFLYEQFLVVLKEYVWNRAHPEGCIMEGYTTEEVVKCYTDYVKDGKWIGLSIPLHEGRLRGRDRMGQKTFVDRDYGLVSEAHFSVLQ
jgi:hypothetical protein